MIFRIARWGTYAAAIITLLMAFHSVPPPAIATNPESAARVDQKMQEVQQAVTNGQPATLRLDQTELNSYLVTHLELSPNAAPQANRAGPSNASSSAPSSTAPAGIPTSSGTTAGQIEQVRSSVRDVKVELVEDRVRAYVVFDFHGKDLTLQLEGRLGAANGYLNFEPVSGQIGSLRIPQSSLQTAVQKMMNSAENREKFKLPPEISGIRIENGELVATYR